ncbi:polysaccharide biosynthesis protein GumN [Caulobacter sp. Root487D2Y]|uniref:TraB/GumN family protein n=1 Tax=Caulobacter sp. Root487D2Y TaxID=1736547 RepID=UPI0006F966FD|nr:TraB/GumN family protein [Caulobacter sp. Root487D2Y]KQY27564.1 polysaccharide biosynthesis protein GumN [Caulobacter sp. Root487D2Y]
MRRLAILAMAAGLLTTTPARAQNPPALDDPEANVVEALVVAAKLPGPAWWRISDGDTTIYMLGVLQALPRGQAWDTSVLDHRLEGAFAVILPPEGKAGLGDLPAALALRGRLKSAAPLDASVGELAPKLARARVVLGKGADAYNGWSPLGAGIMMAGDYRKTVRLEPAEPERAIARLARKHRVKTRPAATYKVMPLVKTAVREHSREAGLICLEGVLDEVNAGPEAARAAARAWARGDVRGAIAGPRNFQRCLLALPGMADLERKGTHDEVEALSAAMNTPGHAVAVFGIRSLVARGGVLDQMRSRGFEVSTPGE